MAEDADPLGIHRKLLRDQPRQLLGDVGIHAVVARPRHLGRVDVEAGAEAEVVARVVPGIPDAARARVRDHDGEAQLGGDALGAGLDDEILLGAAETGEPVEHRPASGLRLRGQAQAEAHGTAGLLRLVAEDALHAAKALVLRHAGEHFFRLR